MRTLVTLTQAAKHVGRDERTLQRWMAQGRLTAYQDGTGRRLVALQEAIGVEADLRSRVKNRQQQRLIELLGPASD